MISVLDPKREVGLWHSVLTVSTHTTLEVKNVLIIITSTSNIIVTMA